MRVYKQILRGHRYIITQVERFGLVLIPAFFSCVLLTGVVGSLLTGLWFVVVQASGSEGPSMTRVQISFIGLYITLAFSAVCIWGYFLYLNVRVFKHVAAQGRASVHSVIQLIAATDFTFAALHYYVALLAREPAYSEIVLPGPIEWAILGDPLDKFLRIPSLETVVDCLYFSSATMATVGFGDIRPLSVLAKAMTTLQIIVSFSLVVVVLGSMASRPTPLRHDEGQD